LLAAHPQAHAAPTLAPTSRQYSEHCSLPTSKLGPRCGAPCECGCTPLRLARPEPCAQGDSLLFAAGAFAGMGKLSLAPLAAVFLTSAVLGDAVNYVVGQKLGEGGMPGRMAMG
jgi:hypothetical protein